jgi:tripartite-type tricarboxylate transporter receptor subunit TctC
MRSWSALLPSAIAAVGFAIPAAAPAADNYPSRAVRIVVGFPASGISDNLTRVLAKALAEQTGQPFLVDNKPGAGTTIAADAVAKAAPDGYTLFMQDLTSHAINASLYKKLPYDSVKDFSPITLVAATPLVMVVQPNSGIKDVADLVRMAKARPGGLNYGSSGIGTILHLAGESFKQRSGVNLLHVPYKGATGAVMAMMGNEINVTFATTPTAVPLVKSGKIKAIAVTTGRRASSMPDIPTMQEAGIQGYEIVLYNGLMGPAGLPADVVARLRTEIARAMQRDDMKAFFANNSAEAITSTPDEMAARITQDIAALGTAVRAAGVQPE